MSQGRATFTMEFAKYLEVPNNVAEAVMKKQLSPVDRRVSTPDELGMQRDRSWLRQNLSVRSRT